MLYALNEVALQQICRELHSLKQHSPTVVWLDLSNGCLFLHSIYDIPVCWIPSCCYNVVN